MLPGQAVSLMLGWVVADRHPLEEVTEADLLGGRSPFAAHGADGAVVGLSPGRWIIPPASGAG